MTGSTAESSLAEVMSADRHARAPEDRFDDFAVGVVGDDDAVLDGVAADNAAGRDTQVEDAGRRSRRAGGPASLVGVPRSKVPGSPSSRMTMQVPLMRRVVGINGGGDEVGEAHVGDEAAALFHLQQRLLPVLPFGDAHLAASMPVSTPTKGIGSVRQKAPRQWRAVLAGLGGAAQRHVVGALLGGAALVNGRQAEASGQAAGGRAGIHPGQLEGDQRQREVLRARRGSRPVRRVHEDAVMPDSSKACSKRPSSAVHSWVLRAPCGHQPGHRAARDGAGGLHQHLQVVAVGKAPQNLADVVVGQRAQVLGLDIP